MQDPRIAFRRVRYRCGAAFLKSFLIVLISFRSFSIVGHLLFHKGIIFSLNLLLRKRYVLELIVLKQLLDIGIGYSFRQEGCIFIVSSILIAHVIGSFLEDQLHRAFIHINVGVAFCLAFCLRAIVGIQLFQLGFNPLLELSLLFFIELRIPKFIGFDRNKLCFHKAVDNVIQ